MEKVMIGKVNVSVSPVVIAGALINGKPNYLTLGNYGGICPRPPAVIYIWRIKPTIPTPALKPAVILV